MISNYYTLRLLAADLDQTLRGSEITEAFCQSKNELLISLKTESDERCLTVSCEPSLNYLFLRSQVHRARKNSVDVFRILCGRLVRSVIIQPADRELVLHCSGDLRLSVRMFGSKANVLLTNDRNTVVDSFLNAKDLRGSVLPQGHESAQEREWELKEFQIRLRPIGSILLPAAIKKLLPFFTTLLIREACFRSRISEQKVVAELSENEVEQLFTSCSAMLKELEESPRARIYSLAGTPPVFSIIPFEHLGSAETEVFDSIHDAIRVFVGKSRKQKSLLQEKESLLQFLRQGVEKAERTLQKMEKETEILQRAMEYERLGKLLMANLPSLQKGMREVELEDVFSRDRSMVIIKLDQKLTPARNAEYYFDKAKKARGGVEEKLEHQDGVRERWEVLREFFDRVSDLQTYDQLAEFTAGARDQLKQLGYKGLPGEPGEKREEAPFRTFVVSGGFQVWVGKNSENNDLLTLKYARPNDLWFHARGSSGSHVVLRSGTGKGEPSRRALEEAASIAAFYSKMKTARNVPVAMTERKYVRKPRGAPAGTVTIEREKLFFVNPKLPAAADQKSAR
jgi:predicted ribosome quality control (RQC) complex YloA/Tae2 family protein